MKRKIYEDLLKWKNTESKIPLMVVGARQIGKTYIINEFCKKEFKKYIYINLLETPEIVSIFSRDINIMEKFKRMEIFLDTKIDIENTVIFFDEVQESEDIISALKFFCESEEKFKIICAGSLLGVKINRFKKSFPVGKVRILNMASMDFEEFLMANENFMLIDEIYNSYNKMMPIDNVLHNKLIELYKMYLCVGGMPEAVKDIINKKMNILEFNKNIASDIIISYLNDMNKYVVSNAESIKIEAIYKSIPTQLSNPSNKFQYSKLNKNARSRDYIEPLNWLISSSMIYKSNLIKNIQIPLKGFIDENCFKLYLSDVGLLTSLLGVKYNDIILDNLEIYKGIITENYVATQFVSNKNDLYYWSSSNKAEIDFLLYNDDGIIPVEVKANKNIKSKSLNMYIEKFKPKYSIRISNKNFGFENGIKSVPLYATFCIK
ncbi:MAG: ATP-binding protein [Christensenellales bacterium]